MTAYDKIMRHGYEGLANESGVPAGGDVFYVDGNSGNAANSGASGQGDSWDLPYSTVNYAISQCSNDAGNVIMVAADHTETIADTSPLNASGSVTDEFCVDKSGVTIIGLGENTRRPTFTLASATDATIDVRASNCTLANLIFYNNIADNVAMLDAQTTADGLTLENCKFHESGSSAEAILQVNITADCDDVTIRGCHFSNALTNDGGLACIKLEGGSDRLRLIDNVIYGDFNEQVIDADTAASTEVIVTGNIINNVDTGVAACIDFHANTTGVVANNTIYVPAGGTGTGAISAAGCLKSGNNVSNSYGVPADVGGASSLHAVYYLDSGTGVDTNDGKSWSTPFATIGAAIDACTASNGDIIYVAAGHAQNLTGAGTTTEMDVDCAGISIIGLGVGTNRPTFTMITDTANAMCDLTADDCLIENIRFLCNIDDGDMLMTVSGDDCTIRNCYFGEGGQTPDECIVVDGGSDSLADDLLIENCVFDIPTADTCNSCIKINRDEDGIIIRNNIIRGDCDEGVIDIPAQGNACTNILIEGNVITNLLTGQHCIQIVGGAVTGIIKDNTYICDTRGAAALTGLCQTFNNKWSKLGTGMDGISNVDANCAGINLFVNSATGTDAAGKGYSWAEPVATIDYAVALCTANQGDVINVAPNHEETLTNAAFIDLDVAGIYVKGHGSGLSKPLITYDHADGEVRFGANDCTWDNFRHRPSVDAVTNGILFEDTFTGCTVKNCDFGFPETATDEFACAIATGDATNYATIENCRFMAGAQAAVSAISLLKDTDHTVIKNCLFSGAYSTCPVLGATTASTNLDIHDNVFMCTGSTDTFNLVAASTGFVRHNTIAFNAASGAAALDIGNCWNVRNDMIADDDVTGAACSDQYVALASFTETLDD
jgi:hypothetical protein